MKFISVLSLNDNKYVMLRVGSYSAEIASFSQSIQRNHCIKVWRFEFKMLLHFFTFQIVMGSLDLCPLVPNNEIKRHISNIFQCDPSLWFGWRRVPRLISEQAAMREQVNFILGFLALVACIYCMWHALFSLTQCELGTRITKVNQWIPLARRRTDNPMQRRLPPHARGQSGEIPDMHQKTESFLSGKRRGDFVPLTMDMTIGLQPPRPVLPYQCKTAPVGVIKTPWAGRSYSTDLERVFRYDRTYIAFPSICYLSSSYSQMSWCFFGKYEWAVH